MPNRHKIDDSGFTLIEVLISLFIFMVGILGVGMMQLTAIKGNSVANRISEATTFASDLTERMMLWDYDDPQLSEDNNVTYTLWNGEDFISDGHLSAPANGNYDAYWEVIDNTPQPDSKTIDLSVIWVDKGVQKTVQLSTVKIRQT